MAEFCKVCGAKLREGAKFCAECGAMVTRPQQPQDTPVYEPPVQQSYEPPVQQSYEPPVQQDYNPPVQQTPSAGGGYVPPAGGYNPPAKNGGKKNNGGKQNGNGGKVAIIIISLVVLVILAITAVFFIVRGLSAKKDVPGVGMYEGVSCSMGGIELDCEDEWVELKPNGEVTLFILGDEYNGKWEMDGDTFLLHQGGDTFEGTLSDGVLTLEFAEMQYVFAMEGAEPSDRTGGVEGRYDCLYYEADGEEYDSEGEWIELKKNGRAILYFMEDEFEGEWELDGEEFLLIQDGDEFSGYLSNGILELEIGDVIYYFADEGYEISGWETEPQETWETEAPTEAPAVGGDYSWWDGDFYGWWVVKQPEEDWQNGQFNFWDVCATIDVNDDGTGYIELWDTDCEPDKVFAQVDVYFGSGTTDYGAMMSEDGYLYNQHIGHADWIIDMGVSNSSGLDQMMCIDGTYVDPEDSSTTFDYLIFLRPWGMSWDDVAVAPSEDLFFDDMMPAHYDDWYLPRMDDPMPDYFEGIVFD